MTAVIFTSREDCNLYIGNLPNLATGEMLTELFSNYGKVIKVAIDKKLEIAMIQMSNSIEGAKALKKLDGFQFAGRTICVSEDPEGIL